MIITSWEEARAAIVEQRGERLAADIEALLRERELIAPASPCNVHCTESKAIIEELEARLVAAVSAGNALATAVLGHVLRESERRRAGAKP